MEPKKSLLIFSLTISVMSTCIAAEAKSVYAGGSEPGVVYKYLGETSWREVSQQLGDAVLCLCEYEGRLYAGTTFDTSEALGSQSSLGAELSVSKKQSSLSRALRSTYIGQVWRYEGGTEWTQIVQVVDTNLVNHLDDEVCSLIVFKENLYAGTAWGAGRLYRYDGGTTWKKVIEYTRREEDPNTPWSGFRSLYVWNDIMYIGDIFLDYFGHYDGKNFTFDADLGGSCIWDYEVYDSNLYASAYQGRVHRSSDGNEWTTIRGNQDYHSWELETFQGHLYVTTGPYLERYDGNEFSHVWTEPNGYEIISMISTEDALILGVGKEVLYPSSGVGKVYAYYGDGNDVNLISEPSMGSGIQSLYSGLPWINLAKSDDVNNGNCVGPGGVITYKISYSYPNEPNLPDINDVNIIDYLPDEVDFDSADSNGIYDPCSNTVTWQIGVLEPNESGFVILTVRVNCPKSTIMNKCEIRGGENLYNTEYEYTPVCCCPTLAKVDGVNDGDCVGPGDYITYKIDYNYPAGPNLPDYNDVNIIDYLPEEVEPNNHYDSNYNPIDQTYTWHIGTLSPGEWGSVTLKVQVKCAAQCGTITNECEMRSENTPIVEADESTEVCCPTLIKVDDVDDDEYTWPNGYITYSICYSANGYGDTNVKIVDDLPDEVNYVSSDPCGSYNDVNHTVTWNDIDFPADAYDCIELVVQVKTNTEPDTEITNQCWMKGHCIDLKAEENTFVGPYPGLYIDEVMADDSCLYIRFEEDDPCDWSGNDYWVKAHRRVRIERTAGSMGKAAYLFQNGWIAAANQQTEPSNDPCFGHQYAFAPNDISFELWFKADTDIDNKAAFFNQAESIERYYQYFEPSGAPAAGRYNTQLRAMTYTKPEEEWGWRYTEPNVWPVDGDWHHLVVTYDEHADGFDPNLRVKMYLDAELVLDDANSGGGTVGPEMDHILIGIFREEYSGGYFEGYIDEFAIYPKVLSPCRIATHYAAWWAKDCNELWDRELVGMQPGIDPIFAFIDHNRDCKINFYDFAIFALDWALCNDPQGGEGCAPNWP